MNRSPILIICALLLAPFAWAGADIPIQVADGIFRSGQPSSAELKQMAAKGIKTVLSLRSDSPTGESVEVGSLGMQLARVGMRDDRLPSYQEVDEALNIMQDAVRRPILVHCRDGKDLTSVVIAAYRVSVEKMDVPAAVAEAKRDCVSSACHDLTSWLEHYRSNRKERGAGRRATENPAVVAPAQGMLTARLALTDANKAFDGAGRRGLFDADPVVFSGAKKGALAATQPSLTGSQRPVLVPSPLTPAQRADLVRRAIDVLNKNQQSFPSAGGGVVHFTAPDKARYPFQWLWDSCFEAIGLRHVDTGRAEDELRSLLKGQWPNGMIPNIVNARADVLASRQWQQAKDDIRHFRIFAALKDGYKALDYKVQEGVFALMYDHKSKSSGITQPPIVAESAMAVADSLPPRNRDAFLVDMYPQIKRYYDWIAQERVQGGLMVVYHSWETGADNSPRFDPVYGVKPGPFHSMWFNLTKKLPAILALKGNDWQSSDRFAAKCVDMNSYYYKNLLALADMARTTGHPQDAAGYEAQAQAVRTAMLSQLWDPKAGAFRDAGMVHGHWQELNAETPAELMPLYAGILDKNDPRVADIVATITDPKKFGTPYPLPSVAVGDPRFDPNGYWRGTSWVNVDYMVAKGLLAYGYTDQARELLQRTLDMVARGGMREYFNPETGEGLGAKNFSWTAALVIEINDMLDKLGPAPASGQPALAHA